MVSTSVGHNELDLPSLDDFISRSQLHLDNLDDYHIFDHGVLPSFRVIKLSCLLSRSPLK